jgi:hypothetical protein
MTQGENLKQQGIADESKQMKSWITSTFFIYSANSPYITCAFYCVTNLNLLLQDSRVLLSCGLGLHNGPTECGVGCKEQLFDSKL